MLNVSRISFNGTWSAYNGDIRRYTESATPSSSQLASVAFCFLALALTLARLIVVLLVEDQLYVQSRRGGLAALAAGCLVVGVLIADLTPTEARSFLCYSDAVTGPAKFVQIHTYIIGVTVALHVWGFVAMSATDSRFRWAGGLMCVVGVVHFVYAPSATAFGCHV